MQKAINTEASRRKEKQKKEKKVLRKLTPFESFKDFPQTGLLISEIMTPGEDYIQLR
jgi:hypothetical protein